METCLSPIIRIQIMIPPILCRHLKPLNRSSLSPALGPHRVQNEKNPLCVYAHFASNPVSNVSSITRQEIFFRVIIAYQELVIASFKEIHMANQTFSKC